MFFSQVWEAVGPFYGKLANGNYLHSMGLVNAIQMHPTDTNTILMATNSSGIWKTTDRGTNWKCVTNSKKLIPGMGVRGFAINPDNPNEIFSGGGNYVYGFDSYDGGLLRSADWGDTWDLVQSFDSIYHDKEVMGIGGKPLNWKPLCGVCIPNETNTCIIKMNLVKIGPYSTREALVWVENINDNYLDKRVTDYKLAKGTDLSAFNALNPVCGENF